MESILIMLAIVAVMIYTGYRFTMYHHPNKAKILIIALFAFASQSCLTVGRIERNCDKFHQVCIDETVKEIVYRDTTIFVIDTVKIRIPADTVTIIDTLTVDYNSVAWLPTIYREFGLVWVRAGVEANILNVAAGITDSTILTPVHDTITLTEVIKEEKITNTPRPVELKYIPKFYKFTFRVFWVLIAAAAIFIIYRIYSTKLKGIIKKLTGK